MLQLFWPADHRGWRLETQTNTLQVGLSTNWVSIPGADNTNQMSFPISMDNGTVLYRLVYP